MATSGDIVGIGYQNKGKTVVNAAKMTCLAFLYLDNMIESMKFDILNIIAMQIFKTWKS